MKRTIYAFLLAALLLGLLAGCGGGGTPQLEPGWNLSDANVPSTASSLSTDELEQLIAEAAETTETPAETEEPAETEAPAVPPVPGVAGAEDMTAVEEVVEEGMVPVYAESLVDGVYPVEMKSSSSMFKAERCELAVEEGQMYAILYMSSASYPYMYAGTAEQAAAAPEEDYIPLMDGAATFTLPLNALDSGESFAAYSRRKELWYDRTLLFRADSLPAEAFVPGFFTTAESLGLADGTYTAGVTLSGGSGKASVASPASLTVAGGVCTARVLWSSSNYDYMVVDGEKYLPVSLEEGSLFEIPVAMFDRPIQVLADTVAMSQPYEIAYTLTFDSASLAAAQ